jgi:hypothetical protein
MGLGTSVNEGRRVWQRSICGKFFLTDARAFGEGDRRHRDTLPGKETCQDLSKPGRSFSVYVRVPGGWEDEWAIYSAI